MLLTIDSEVAEKYGLNCAVLIPLIQTWIARSIANEEEMFEDRHWVSCSLAAFHAMLPFFTKNQIRYALDRLVDEGVLLKGKKDENFNRTNYYAFVDEALQIRIWGFSQMHLGKADEASPNNIYNNNIYTNNYNNPLDVIPSNVTKVSNTTSSGINISQLVGDMIEHRKIIKPKMSEKAQNLLFNKLSRLQKEGYDIVGLTNQAIESGWKTVYPHKDFLINKSKANRPEFIRGGINPDITEEDAYEQWRRAEQSHSNGNDQPVGNCLPDSSNPSSN